MRKVALLSIFGLLAADLLAVRHAVFETDLYNRVIPRSCQDSVVFSPLSSEIDLAVAAESLDTIARANVAEQMGVLVEFGSVYRPLLAHFSDGTNGFSFTTARGFCLPDLRKTRPDYCVRIQQDYGTEVMPLQPDEGVRCWFRAAMDGQMEDFEVGPEVSKSDRYSFFDLVSVRAAWLEPFPTSGVRRLSFTTPERTTVALDFMTDIRVAETWEEREYDILKLPLRGGYSFYALLPKPGIELARVREDFSPMEIETLLAMTGTGVAAVGRYRREPTVLVIPRLDLESHVDMTGALQSCRVPTSSLTYLAPDIAANRFEQRVRLVLREFGPGETPLGERPLAEQQKVAPGMRRLILNRPFLYFVLDNESSVIPVAGQFTGLFGKVVDTKAGVGGKTGDNGKADKEGKGK